MLFQKISMILTGDVSVPYLGSACASLRRLDFSFPTIYSSRRLMMFDHAHVTIKVFACSSISCKFTIPTSQDHHPGGR
jgi:hypothetical protein